MTPLAHRIVKELTLPLKRRTFVDDGGLLARMDEVHCFEVSEVIESGAAHLLGQEALSNRLDARMAFLPAPNTWIEWTDQSIRGRFGLLLSEVRDQDGSAIAARTWAATSDGSYEGGFLPLRHRLACFENSDSAAIRGLDCRADALIYGVLAMINTPRIVGRRQHLPHRGLQRELAAARGLVGRFPLHAWTEIKLQVGPPKDCSSEPSREARLTGDRALHFCRAHLRVRGGRLETVRSHWRGDPSLGIKRSRYKLAA